MFAGVQVPPGCRYFAVQSGGKLFTGLFKRNLLKLTDFISRGTQPRGATPDYTLTKLAVERVGAVEEARARRRDERGGRALRASWKLAFHYNRPCYKVAVSPATTVKSKRGKTERVKLLSAGLRNCKRARAKGAVWHFARNHPRCFTPEVFLTTALPTDFAKSRGTLRDNVFLEFRRCSLQFARFARAGELKHTHAHAHTHTAQHARKMEMRLSGCFKI